MHDEPSRDYTQSELSSVNSRGGAKSHRMLSNRSLSIDADSRLIKTAHSNYKKSRRAKSVQNDSFELIYIDGYWVERRQIKRTVWNYFTEVLSSKLVFLKESPASMINRILNNPKMQVGTVQGLLLSQVITAVEVKVFASDLSSENRITEVLPSQRQTEEPIDVTMFTGTFRVGLKTQISHLLKSAYNYWGLCETNAVLYIVEEDGSVRDLQYDMNSCVIKIVEQYFTHAIKHRHKARSKLRKTDEEYDPVFSGFDPVTGDYRPVFYLSRVRRLDADNSSEEQ